MQPSSGDHDSVTYGSDRVSQSTMLIVTISDQSVQTDRPNSQTEFNSAVSDCIPDVYSINQSGKDYSDQSNKCYCETTITVLIDEGSLK